jgi:hypothetical protein
MENTEKKIQNHLRVFDDRSEYYSEDGTIEIFSEGVISNKAKKRIARIRDAFKNNYLENLICKLSNGEAKVNVSVISDEAIKCINMLVDSLTSEVGRALIGLSVMQLCVKSIEPEQNIRLHKGGSSRNSFSWVEGISMRSLDKEFVTPILRKYDLLRLNADGFMMTRSLAENYPYTILYKAQIRGARIHWLNLVEEVEKQHTSAKETLKYLIARLINAASEFEKSAIKLFDVLNQFLSKSPSITTIISIMTQHSERSDYAARLLEINMHALMQVASESGAFGLARVQPLSQMRSANKKHGNIGDIELMENGQIIESWDAKYGKGYLREEIEEAVEKLQKHEYVETVGFVTNVVTDRSEEIINRIHEIEEMYSIQFKIIQYQEWVDMIISKTVEIGIVTEVELATQWLKTYCEYLCQRRRDIAPIDEPCSEWVASLTRIIEEII